MTKLRDLLRSNGAEPALAERILNSLAQSGLSSGEMRRWLASPSEAHPIVAGSMEIAGEKIARRKTPIFAIEDGEGTLVLDEAERFRALSPAGRAVSRTFGLTSDEVRRLSRADDERLATIAEISRLLRNALKKDTHVYDVVHTILDDHAGARIIDLVAQGRENDVLEAIRDGSIDPARLLSEGMVASYDW